MLTRTGGGISAVVYELNDLIFMGIIATAVAGAVLLAVGIYRHCKRDRKN